MKDTFTGTSAVEVEDGGVSETGGRRRTSRLAIASTAVSVLAVVLVLPLLAVIGAALGVVAINRVRARELGGLRWAVAGVVIGLTWLAVLLALIAFGVIGPAEDPAT